ncbi:response regulator [archaeon]|nr:response regulator [archaeon]
MDDITEKLRDDSQPRVLVVDSSEAIGSGIHDILAEQGFRVDVAGSATQAIEMFNRGNYVCVLTEYNLPEMDGADLARMMRSKKDVPIVLMSQRRENYWQSTQVVAAFLQKPFQGYKLVETVREHARAQPPQQYAA